MPQTSIRVPDDFYHAVEKYRQEHHIQTWSQAIIHLAAIGLGTNTPPTQWGGARQGSGRSTKARFDMTENDIPKFVAQWWTSEDDRMNLSPWESVGDEGIEQYRVRGTLVLHTPDDPAEVAIMLVDVPSLLSTEQAFDMVRTEFIRLMEHLL